MISIACLLFFAWTTRAADTDSAIDLFNMQRYRESFEFFERLSYEEESSAQLKAYHAVAAAKAGRCDRAEQISSSLSESEFGEIKTLIDDNCKTVENHNLKTLTATIGPRNDSNAESIRNGRPGASLYVTTTLAAKDWQTGVRSLSFKETDLSSSAGTKIYGQYDLFHFPLFGLNWTTSLAAETYFLDTNADQKFNLEYIRAPLSFMTSELDSSGYEFEVAGQFTTVSEIESLKGPSSRIGYWKRFGLGSADFKISPYATINQVVSDDYAYYRGGVNLSYQTRWKRTVPGAYIYANYSSYHRHSQGRKDTNLGGGGWLTWMFSDSYFTQASAEYSNQNTNIDTYKYSRFTALLIFGGQWDI